APDVVPERDGVGPGCEQLVRELRRDPDAVGDVLAVDDDDVGVELVTQGRQPLLDRSASRHADDVGHEQEFQGSVRVGAPRSSIETWFPASCVKRASAWCSTLERSSTRPTFVVEAAMAEPTVNPGSATSRVRETT